MTYRAYFDCFGPKAMHQGHPIGLEFFETFGSMSRDTLIAWPDTLPRQSHAGFDQ